MAGDGEGRGTQAQAWMRAVADVVAGDQFGAVLCRTAEAAKTLLGAASAVMAPPDLEGVGEHHDGVVHLRPDDEREPAELRAPIEVDGVLAATLVVLGPADGTPFGSDDEELVAMLASVASSVLGRLALRRDGRRRRWLALLHEIATAPMAGSHADDVLALAAEGARELAGADLAVVCVGLPVLDHAEVRGADGAGADLLLGARFDAAGTALADALSGAAGPVPLDGGTGCEPLTRAGVHGPALLVPLTVHARPAGVLVVGRAAAVPFDDDDRWLLESFACQVGTALGYGRAQLESGRVAVAADQERIARDLHDTVIQRLFAIGMSLQALPRTCLDREVEARAQEAVDGLDATIRDIRATVGTLRRPPLHEMALRTEIGGLVGELASAYGLEHRVCLRGAGDDIPDALAADIVATVREAVSNAGRHARAAAVEVDIDVSASVVVRVTDDGVGIADRPNRWSGLRNLAERAELRGGTLRVRRRPGGGTVVTWRVPQTMASAHWLAPPAGPEVVTLPLIASQRITA